MKVRVLATFKVADNHPVFVCNGQMIEWVNEYELKEGDTLENLIDDAKEDTFQSIGGGFGIQYLDDLCISFSIHK